MKAWIYSLAFQENALLAFLKARNFQAFLAFWDKILEKKKPGKARKTWATLAFPWNFLTVCIVFVRVTCKLFEFIGFLYSGYMTFQIWS